MNKPRITGPEVLTELSKIAKRLDAIPYKKRQELYHQINDRMDDRVLHMLKGLSKPTL